MLAARPIPNAAAVVGRPADGGAVIRVRRERSWLTRPPLSWIVPAGRERRVALDARGAQAWDLCDGRRTVEEVVDVCAARLGLTFHESRVAVTGYLRELIRRGVLAIELADAP